MELIIKIPEKVYKTVQDGSYCGSLYEELKAAIPYNPSGDLISREALKNDISEKVCDKFERWNKTITCAEFETFIRDVIDNAPTIEFPTVINMKPLTAEEKQGLIDAFKKSGLKAVKLDDGRTRGECKTCRYRDPEDKKCDCGELERQGCLFRVSDDYYCKFYERR